MSDIVKPFSFGGSRRLVALLITAALVFLGGVAAMAPIDSAVMGAGTVKVEGSVKSVQHIEGGVVRELYVRDGQQVKAGDLVLRLDARELEADLTALNLRLIEVEARRLRLIAERDGGGMAPRPDLPEQLKAPDYADFLNEVLRDEARLLSQRRESVTAQLAQLEERIGQLTSEAKGLRAQLAAAGEAITLVQAELTDLTPLSERKLIPISRLRSTQREAVDLQGNQGALQAELARSEGEMTENRQKILQLTQDSRIEILEELRRIETERADLQRRIIAAEARLERALVHAPVSGRVHELAVHTLGGVLTAGETAMLIVPAEEALTVEVRIAPADVDQVWPGQAARLRFSAFNQRTTPEVEGVVTRVSADLSNDPATGASWYSLHIQPDAEAMQALDGLVLMPGMPAEAYMLGSSRTIMSYLLKPALDQFATALREE